MVYQGTWKPFSLIRNPFLGESDDLLGHRNFKRPLNYPTRMSPICAKLWENAFQMFLDISFFKAENKKNKQTLNGRLHLDHGSDRRETLGKRVSDEWHFFFHAHPKFNDFSKFWCRFLFRGSCVLEVARIFERHWQIPLRKIITRSLFMFCLRSLAKG